MEKTTHGAAGLYSSTDQIVVWDGGGGSQWVSTSSGPARRQRSARTQAAMDAWVKLPPPDFDLEPKAPRASILTALVRWVRKRNSLTEQAAATMGKKAAQEDEK